MHFNCLFNGRALISRNLSLCNCALLGTIWSLVSESASSPKLQVNSALSDHLQNPKRLKSHIVFLSESISPESPSFTCLYSSDVFIPLLYLDLSSVVSENIKLTASFFAAPLASKKVLFKEPIYATSQCLNSCNVAWSFLTQWLPLHLRI